MSSSTTEAPNGAVRRALSILGRASDTWHNCDLAKSGPLPGRSPSRLPGASWSSASEYRRHRPPRPPRTRVLASPGGTASRPHSAAIGSDPPDRQRRPMRGRRSRAVRRGHRDVRASVADRAPRSEGRDVLQDCCRKLPGSFVRLEINPSSIA